MQLHIYKYTIFILLVLSYEDIKSQSINLISILLLGISIMPLNKHWSTYILTSSIFIPLYIFQKNKIGSGDIITISLCSLLIPLENLGCFLILIGSTSYLACKITKKMKTPLIPFITIAFLTLIIFNLL